MRKTRVIAFVVASLVSTASLAGAQAPTQTPPAKAGRHAMGPGMEGREHRGMLRGIKLSDAEKAKLKEIHSKYAAESKSLRESMKPAMQDARAARQKGDTAAARAAFERTKADREKMTALMQHERAEVRAALSPENQKQFDANVQEMAKRRTEWAKNGKGGRRGMGGFHGQRSGRAG